MKLITFIEVLAKPKYIVLMLLGYFVFPFYFLPAILPNNTPLDLHLFYSTEQAYDLLASLTELERARYRLGLSTTDVVYPIYYATFLAVIIAFITQRIKGQNGDYFAFKLLPFAVMVLDLLENISIIYLISIFPDYSSNLGLIAGYLTLGKWLLFATVVFTLVCLTFRLYQTRKL